MKGNIKLIFLILTALVFAALAFLISGNRGKTSKINDSITDFFKGEEKTVTVENPKGVLTLDIISPQNNQIVQTPAVKVQGKTLSGAEVFVNDKETMAKTDGTFSVSVALDEGDNIIVVSVNDDLGNYLEKEVSVTLQSFE